jgi:hypothetical protein
MKKRARRLKQIPPVSLDKKIKSGWENRLKNINSKPSSKNLSSSCVANNTVSSSEEGIVAFPIGY